MRTQIILIGLLLGAFSISYAQQSAVLTRTDSVGCDSLSATFTISQIVGNFLDITWDFDDGSPRVQGPLTVTHTYSSPGTYNTSALLKFYDGTNFVWLNYYFQGRPLRVGEQPIINSISSNQKICGPGFYDFSVDVAPQANLTYEWKATSPNGTVAFSNQTVPSFHFDQGGTYDVQAKVISNQACADSISITVELDEMELNEVILDASCQNSDGQITINPLLGGMSLPQMQVNWSNGNTGLIAQNLSKGIYTLEILWDSAGSCSYIDSLEVNESGNLDYEIIIGNPSCSATPNGEIIVNINNSDGPVNYVWSTGETTKDISNLSAGNYSLSISDNICSFDENLSLDVDSMHVSLNTQNPDCAGNNGAIELAVTGGRPPYTFDWSNGIQDSINAGIPEGGYSVVVSDSFDCKEKWTVVLESDSCFYTISGRIFHDENGNCTFDANDYPLSEGWVSLNLGEQYTQLDEHGFYSFQVKAGNYIVRPELDRSFENYNLSCPSNSQTLLAVTSSDISENNYALSPNGSMLDVGLEIITSPIRPAREHYYHLFLRNKGTIFHDGSLSLTHDSLLFTFYPTLMPTSYNYNSSIGKATWSYFDLLPGENKKYELRGGLSPTIPGNTPIKVKASVLAIGNEINLDDNQVSFTKEVKRASSEVEMEVLSKGIGAAGFVDSTDNIRQYNIWFSNEQDFQVEYVTIRDTIDPKLDLTTLKPIGASHPYTIKLVGRVLEISFENINLPPSNVDPAASQGFIGFKINHLDAWPHSPKFLIRLRFILISMNLSSPQKSSIPLQGQP
ncbi:MAG: PKD domain-containing protein [Bacteroidia bacterium]|nr:PKD domain-containing protein [Bacteroidia bacterium]